MSLTKGQNFERQVAKLFSEWSGIKLVRTPMSGAWEGCEVDIWPENPEVYWPLAIECKKAESWNMDQVMEGTGPVYEWLQQAEQQAREWGKRTGKWREPVLVFSRNRRPIYVAFPRGASLFHFNTQSGAGISSVLSGSRKAYYVMALKDFLEEDRFDDIKYIIELISDQENYALQREESGSTL